MAKFLRPAKYGEVVRFALLDKAEWGAPWKRAWVHGKKGQGVFRCLDPKTFAEPCCKAFGESKESYYTIAVRYNNAETKKGLLVKGAPLDIEIVPLKLSPYAYESIMSLRNPEEESDSIFGFDIAMGQAAQDILKGYAFTRMSSPPRYREVAKANIAELIAPWLDGTKLTKAIAKQLSKAEVRALVNGVDEPADLADLEEVN